MGNRGKKKSRKKWLLLLLIPVFILGVCSMLYFNDYYHADESALSVIEGIHEQIEVLKEEHPQEIVFKPEECKAGLILYPGAKVEYSAYAPLMEACAERGILSVVVHMPGNFAIFDMDAAKAVKEKYPEVKSWYLAGHSLGGAIGAVYISEHTDEYAGLILLAAYSIKDLTDSGLKVLSVYGDQDQVLSQNTYQENKTNLPEGFVEMVIEGGCHAYFGSYGPQKGDGTAAITREEQVSITADAIAGLIRQE